MSNLKIKFPEVSPKLKSRKLWLALISAVIPVLNQELGWDLDSEVVVKVVQALWLWIVVEGAYDTARALK